MNGATDQRALAPVVSVLIPTYRQAVMAERAVRSALAQDYPALRVHVIDDASPDDTAQRIATLTDPRLTFHRNPHNLGRVANYRHALYDIAEGGWVVNLDGDDEFVDPGFIGKAVAAAQDDVEIVMVAARAITRVGTRDRSSGLPPQRLYDGRTVAMRSADPAFHLMHLATLYRRDAALACDFYRVDAISADWESLYRLACRGKVAFIDCVAGIWHVAESGASQSMRAGPQLANLHIWDSIEGELIARGIGAAEARQAMRRAAQAMARVHGNALAVRAPREALRYLAGMRTDIRAALLLSPAFWLRLAAGAVGLRR